MNAENSKLDDGRLGVWETQQMDRVDISTATARNPGSLTLGRTPKTQ